MRPTSCLALPTHVQQCYYEWLATDSPGIASTPLTVQGAKRHLKGNGLSMKNTKRQFLKSQGDKLWKAAKKLLGLINIFSDTSFTKPVFDRE